MLQNRAYLKCSSTIRIKISKNRYSKCSSLSIDFDEIIVIQMRVSIVESIRLKLVRFKKSDKKNKKYSSM